MARKPRDESSSFVSKEDPTFRRAVRHFRSRVRELRRMHGLSYADLHQRSGVNWRQLIAIEKGEPVNPTLVTLTRLADAFGVEVQDLLLPARSGVRRKESSSERETSEPAPPAKKKSGKLA